MPLKVENKNKVHCIQGIVQTTNGVGQEKLDQSCATINSMKTCLGRWGEVIDIMNSPSGHGREEE